ncbi:MAG: ADP-ribosylglycohydrolase family protein [Deltaproteobacteria bacterium]|nr:ADP-ribosylglycohydrolase family protein [Nannocystaceae bacterium]
MVSPELTRRFRGCLLGGAVGDALGAAVEFMSLAEIRSRHGPRGIAEYAEIHGRRGSITDDTQMTLFTAEGLIRLAASRGGAHPLDVATSLHRSYLRWLHTQSMRSAHPAYDDALDGWLIRLPELHSHRAPGNTCLSALRLPQAGAVQHPINDSKGCGGVMRVAPVGLFGERVFDVGCQSCAITHGHPSGYLAGGAFATMVAFVAGGTPLPQAIAHVREHYDGVLGDEVRGAIDGAMRAASKAPRSPETVESLGAGWVAEEALAIAIYCALVAHDFADGVTLAVNHSGDSDSTGSMVGNLLGAAWGVEAIPPGWLEPLELRDEITTVADDLALAHCGESIDTSRYPPH